MRGGRTRRQAGGGRGARPVHLDVPAHVQDDLAHAEEGAADRDGRPEARRRTLAGQGRHPGCGGQGLRDLHRGRTRGLNPGVPQEQLVHHRLSRPRRRAPRGAGWRGTGPGPRVCR
ncbi:hypothetical protein SBRY_30887 [Actinacidiphila bryophytorum]|uniref:Uncharacterized protein n=1 Tax=Actinacidiphila bryophytorum TaxID=1436133 RepID=A0A9W4H1V4_9ACTN|nr:hypothetical protein SBRY_30887 [Actinacidiphila bryophytorum]